MSVFINNFKQNLHDLNNLANWLTFNVLSMFYRSDALSINFILLYFLVFLVKTFYN